MTVTDTDMPPDTFRRYLTLRRDSRHRVGPLCCEIRPQFNGISENFRESVRLQLHSVCCAVPMVVGCQRGVGVVFPCWVFIQVPYFLSSAGVTLSTLYFPKGAKVPFDKCVDSCRARRASNAPPKAPFCQRTMNMNAIGTWNAKKNGHGKPI